MGNDRSSWRVHARQRLPPPRLTLTTTIQRSISSLNDEIVFPEENLEIEQMQGVSSPMKTKSTLDHTEILSAVLQELDMERSRRCDLEEQFRRLREEHAGVSSKLHDEQSFTRRHVVSLQAERDGYKELIEALTAENRAISAARTASQTTLPLHVVRLLEIMPWDTRAHQHTTVTEEVYEWQVYKQGKWCGMIRNFPTFFKLLPTVQPQPGDTMPESLRRLFYESPPKRCVLTNDNVTQVINIDDGYPLPADGATWQWIGGWRVNKRVLARSPSSTRGTVDCDKDGWSYTENPMHFVTLPTELCWDNPGLESCRRIFRRRKWTRRRALVDYPFASERTKHYLSLLAENACLVVTTTKLSDQLVETKMQLTQAEERHMESEERIRLEVLGLKQELTSREEELSRGMEVGLSRGTSPVIKTKLVERLGQKSLSRGTLLNLASLMQRKLQPGSDPSLCPLTTFDDVVSSTTTDDSNQSSFDEGNTDLQTPSKHLNFLDHIRSHSQFLSRQSLSAVNGDDLTKLEDELIKVPPVTSISWPDGRRRL